MKTLWRRLSRFVEYKADALGRKLSTGWSPKHYFLMYVPEGCREKVEQSGFVECVSKDGKTHVWVEPYFFKGPLAGVKRDDVEGRLLWHGAAGQIFVAKMWGAGPD